MDIQTLHKRKEMIVGHFEGLNVFISHFRLIAAFCASSFSFLQVIELPPVHKGKKKHL